MNHRLFVIVILLGGGPRSGLLYGESRRKPRALARGGCQNEQLGERAGTYHQVLFLPFESDVQYGGYGEAPGQFALVNSTIEERGQRNMVVHELLHNVMGTLEAPQACDDDPIHYCEDGWLQSTVTYDEDDYLPHPLAEEIERDGFED